MSNGWIKLHREILDKSIWVKSTPEQKTILITLMLMANHQERRWEWQGQQYSCNPGQFITSLENIVSKCGGGVTTQNVRTALKRFEKLGFLTNESTNKGRLITIENWDFYQCDDLNLTDELTSNQQAPNKHLTSNQQAPNKHLTTNKNDKEYKNVENEKNVEECKKEKYSEEIKEIITYLNTVCGTRYSHSSDKSCKHIRARLNENFTVDDFKTVIDKKAKEWIGDPKMSKFLRPETLFGTKFEGYLNQIDSEPRGSTNTFAGVDWSKV